MLSSLEPHFHATRKWPSHPVVVFAPLLYAPSNEQELRGRLFNCAGMNNATRLSWNQIRANAARFAEDWKTAKYERGETQSFYNDFFEVWGVKRRKVASFEEPVKKLGGKQGFIDLFWKGVLLVEQKSAGRKLEPDKMQALEYLLGLKVSHAEHIA